MADPHIAVFRHTIFLRSEQFIPLQVSKLTTRATLVTRDAIINPVESLEARTLTETGEFARIRHSLGDSRPLERILREIKADVLHAHFGVEGVFSLDAARRLGIPHVTTFHGFDATLTESALIRSRKLTLARFAMERNRFLASGSTFVCVSDHLRKRIEERGAPPDRIHVIPTGVDTDSMLPSALPDGCRVVHVARLVEKKGTADLIRAFKILSQTNPDAELTIVGDGPLRQRLGLLSDELGMGGHVRFVGSLPHDQVLDEIRRANLLCLPSVSARSGDEEGLGQVILEAGALGRATVGTAHGGIGEAVANGKSGLLVPEHDVPALAEALRVILSSRALQEQMATYARADVVARFNATDRARELSSLYRSLA